jgi:hypothetical protein
MALPGRYQVRLTVDGNTQTAPFELKLDPRVSVSAADLQKQFDLGIQIREEISKVFEAANQVLDVRTQVDGIRRRIAERQTTKPLLASATSLDQKLVAVRDELIQVKVQANEDSLSYPPGIDSKLALLAISVSSDTDSAPTEAAYQVFDKLKRRADESLARWADLQRTDLAAFQKLTAEQNIQAVVVPSPADLDGESGGHSHR